MIMSEENADLIFRVLNQTEEVNGEYITKEITFADAFVAMTDYSEATDFMEHDVASLVGNTWMLKCGIPVFLRKLVDSVCYQPRRILFSASGYLLGIGKPYDGDESLRYVVLRRGILMGDPLTKVVLHLVNASVRQLGSILNGQVKEGSNNLHNLLEVVETVRRTMGLKPHSPSEAL